MEFVKYPHIERIGSDDVEGILEGTCYVFPKIDGTNASVWLEDGVLNCGSRRRELSLESDNAGFCAYIDKFPFALSDLLVANPTWTLYGEWLVPHTLKTYREDAWRKFYIFDVFDNLTGKFVPYDTYALILDEHDLTYIPLMVSVDNPTEEWLTKKLDANTYLVEDGKGYGEGIVVKNYDFVNGYGRTTWLKFVRNEFKEHHGKEWGAPKVSMKNGVEQDIASEYITAGRVEKVAEKMRESGSVNSRRIPELLSRTWNDIISDEMWDILKRYKNPTIDFKKFNRCVITEIKRVYPSLFGG